MKRLFTLIELIVVIAVLGILAAIIIPNISSFQEEANTTAIKSNVRNLQTGVDMYSLDNYSSVPTLGGQPTEFEPKPVNFEEMHPDYSRDLPKTPGVKYWVDGWGKVWASTIDAPKNVDLTNTTLKWDTVPEADMYKVYKILNPTNTTSSLNPNTKLVFYKEATKDENIGFPVDDENIQYAVSAIDKNKFESAPAGSNYSGYENYISQQVVDIYETNYNIGDKLTAPEKGWKRYDNSDINIKYAGTNWYHRSNYPNDYNNTISFYHNNGSNHKVSFKFKGSRLRLTTTLYADHSSNVIVNIDGVEYSGVNMQGSTTHQILVFNKTDLNNTEHTVEIYSGDGSRFAIDAIDINEDGLLWSGMIPLLSDYTSEIGEVIYSSEYENHTEGYEAYQAFNDLNGDPGAWVSKDVGSWGVGHTEYIGFKFNSPKVITGYTLTSYYANHNHDPTHWRFQGYNGSNWIDLDVRENEVFNSTLQKNNYTFSNNTSYSSYRLLIEDITVNSFGYAAIQRLELFE